MANPHDDQQAQITLVDMWEVRCPYCWFTQCKHNGSQFMGRCKNRECGRYIFILISEEKPHFWDRRHAQKTE